MSMLDSVSGHQEATCLRRATTLMSVLNSLGTHNVSTKYQKILGYEVNMSLHRGCAHSWVFSRRTLHFQKFPWQSCSTDISFGCVYLMSMYMVCRGNPARFTSSMEWQSNQPAESAESCVALFRGSSEVKGVKKLFCFLKSVVVRTETIQYFPFQLHLQVPLESLFASFLQ